MKIYNISEKMTLVEIEQTISEILADSEMEHAIQNPQFFSKVENAIVTHNLCVLRGLYLLKEVK